MDIKLNIPNEAEKYSNICRACRICECSWCIGQSYTLSSVLMLCYPCYYKNIKAQCCCFILNDDWKKCCCVLDFLMYPIVLLLFPFLLIIGLVMDFIQLVFGILTCNCCCYSCRIYDCCKIEDVVEHNRKEY